MRCPRCFYYPMDFPANFCISCGYNFKPEVQQKDENCEICGDRKHGPKQAIEYHPWVLTVDLLSYTKVEQVEIMIREAKKHNIKVNDLEQEFHDILDPYYSDEQLNLLQEEIDNRFTIMFETHLAYGQWIVYKAIKKWNQTTAEFGYVMDHKTEKEVNWVIGNLLNPFSKVYLESDRI